MSAPDTYGATPGSTGDDGAKRDRLADESGEADEQVAGIRENIEQTRAQMSETIDALQQRLNPTYIKEQVREQVLEHVQQAKESVRQATIGKVENMVERVSDTVYETRRSVVDTVTANPIPSALVGIGLAWLWMNRRSDSERSAQRYGARYRTDDYDELPGQYAAGRSYRSSWQDDADDRSQGNSLQGVRSVASKAGEAISGMAGQVQQTASELADKTKRNASDLADKTRRNVSAVVGQAQQTGAQLVNRAQYQAQRVEQRVNSALRENPLAVGAVALAIGTAVGLAVPQTRKENEWMGEARDNLMDKAQSVATEAIEQVQQGVQQVAARGDGGSQSQSTQGGAF